MKKRIALLVGVLFVLIAVFAACGQTTPTERYVRWNQDEKHTFKITLSDFAGLGSDRLFNKYTREFDKVNDQGETTKNAVTCYKDDVITNSESLIMEAYDQLRPVDAQGTFTLEIKYGTNVTLVTDQKLYSQYNTETLQALNCLDALKDRNVTNKDENPFTDNNGRTTLCSTTHSEVVFKNDANQWPISSVTENKGFYIGKLAQSLSDYKYEATYDFDNGKVSVKKNGGEAVEQKLSGKCIDANQLLLYMRSLDKSSEAFKDNPSVSVYDVTTGTVSTASFALSRQFYLLFDNNGSEAVISVNSLLSSVGGVPFMAQYNLPDVSTVGDGYDFLPKSASRLPKYTTVKFRSGWYSYEMEVDEYFQQAIDAIKLKNEVA